MSQTDRSNTESPGFRWRWWVDGPLFALVVAIYLGAQLTMLKPPALEGGDQLDYFSTAANLPDVVASHRHLRLGLLFPVRTAIEVFGYSEAAYYLVPISAGVLLCGSTFLLGKILFGRWVAVAAALLVVVNPYVLWDSSHLLPDIPGAALFTAGILSVTVGAVRYKSGVVDRWPTLLFVLGGLLLGWSYMNREYLVILFPLALLALYIYRVPWKKAGWVVLGTLPPLMVELVWGWAVYRDPLIRIATAGGLRGTSGTGSPTYATEASEVLTILGSNFIRFPGGWVFVAIFIAGVVLGTIAIASGNRKFWLPLAWAAGIWTLLTLIGLIPVFLTDGRGTYLRLQKFRYWLPVLPGLVILGFAVIDWGVKLLARQSRWIMNLGVLGMLTLVVATAYVGTSSIAGNSSYVRNGSSQYIELRDFLQSEGSAHEVISTDTGIGQALGLVLPIYTRTAFGTPIWDGEIRPLGHNTDFIELEEVEPGLVISRPESYRWLVAHRDQFLPPDYLLNPPSTWQPVMISQNGAVIIYSTEAEEPKLVGETAPHEWRRTDGEDFIEPDVSRIVTFHADSHETVTIVDVDGLALQAGGSQRASVQSDIGEIWGRVEAETEGSGRLTINCLFTGAGESTTSVRGVVRGRYNVGVESLDYRCDIPDGGGPLIVDVEIELRGPIDLSIGSNRVHFRP